ncbi:hypothetical protein ACIPW5_05190 [Streptomyces sp. NPDC090077]|uniref:hypothetical protein n=1 Tax=Streptomyces sp. NPDC090077 TaxID=3365938 RepID=UPI0037FF14FD
MRPGCEGREATVAHPTLAALLTVAASGITVIARAIAAFVTASRRYPEVAPPLKGD